MLRRLAPLRVRLPLTVALLLAVCTASVVTIAYRTVRGSVTSAATQRLRAAGERIVSLLEPSVRRAQTDAARIATLPGVVPWAHGGSPDAVRAHLDSIRTAGPNVAAVVLTRRDGGTVMSGDSAWAHPASPVENGVGPFFVHDSTPGYAVASPLVSGRDTLGRVTIVRKLAGNNASAQLLAGMLGTEASMRIGNADGTTWTDFVKFTAPPVDAAGLRDAEMEHGTTGDTLAVALRIAGTPWALWIGQPAAAALAPATALIKRLAILALLSVGIGAAIAWWAILRFTAPLGDLAKTSDAIAAGDYARRIDRLTTDDEVGRAAIAFNHMASEIATQHARLESEVRARTAELEAALADLHDAQEEVVRKERLATLGQLAGGVGHELRNPLGVMTNALFVLETALPDPDPLVRDYIGILKNQIMLSEKIVSDLLDYARTKPASRAPVAVETIARQQTERLGALQQVRVEWDIPGNLPMVNVDSIQIGQVVLNLVTNAVQAMSPGGGTLTLRAYHDGNGSAVLEVRDTGPGMTDDVARRIFEPLYTTKAKGLGLGLAVSRMLANNNDCRLSFVTQPGTGTTFSLALPVAPYE